MKFCGMIIVLLAVFMASVWGQQEPLTLEYASLVSHIALILFVYISDAACVCWLIGTAGSEAESPSLVPRPDSGDCLKGSKQAANKMFACFNHLLQQL